jgi:DNA polymerase I-like protein with 3'-5' exonuclease and polymerase domains
MKVYFDIETNAINDWLNLTDLKQILCMAVSIDGEDPQIVDIKDGLTLLQNADEIIGHNIQSFDIPALKRLYPNFVPARMVDTLLTARLLYADQRERDFQIKDFPKELIGSQSLGAWGVRLNAAKAKAPGFDHDSDELREYCKQDVRVTVALYKYLMEHPAMPAAQRAIDLEHDFAAIIREQEKVGFPFNMEAAQRLHSDLLMESHQIEKDLQVMFPPVVIERISEKTGKRLKPKIDAFNPGSRQQIAQRLKDAHGWEPVELTPDGKPRVDEAVLATLTYPEAKALSRYLTIQKRLGQLADGDEAWMKAVASDGRLHGRVNTNGAITGRCTHRSPNMAQIPTDKEYRSLFVPSKGKVLVGADASGLELRCLAHFLGKYDGGAYCKAVVDGDIHWTNAIAFGLTSDTVQDKSNPAHKAARNQAKGAIYALIYGAGNEKLGMVLGGNKNTGAKARRNFEAKVPAYLRLKEDVSLALSTKGFLRGLDSRPLYPRSEHAALNTLLQSAGAVVMKQACVNAWRVVEDPMKNGVEQVASVHDEYQFMVFPNYAEKLGNILVCAIRKAGEDFDFRCPLDGEFRVGANWAETH